jgi:hypothetical protein
MRPLPDQSYLKRPGQPLAVNFSIAVAKKAFHAHKGTASRSRAISAFTGNRLFPVIQYYIERSPRQRRLPYPDKVRSLIFSLAVAAVYDRRLVS